MNALRNFFITFVIALLIFGLCAFFITGFVTDSINGLLQGEKPQDGPDTTSEATSDDSAATVVNPPDDIQGESFNILLIGTDYRPSILHDYHPNVASQYPQFKNSASLVGYDGKLPEYPYRTVNADAVVLVCVNKENQQVTYMQIPACMQLTVGGVTTTVAELYYDKGLEYFVNKMAGITGVNIDYYALTGIEEIANVVDKMGTVLYTVPCDMQYTDDISGLTISLTAGSQNLDGQAAAGMLSFNEYTNASLSREKTMLSFLKALAQKMTNVTYLNKAAGIFSNIEKYLCTNISATDLAENLDLIFSYGEFDVQEIDYPGSYYYDGDGVKYFTPNISGAITAMAKTK